MENDLFLRSDEYSIAYKDMVEIILRSFIKHHPWLANVAFYTTQHSGPTTYPDAPQPLEQEMAYVETAATFNLNRCDPDIESHTEGLVRLAEFHRDNMLHQIYGRLDAVCIAHGNVVNQQGRPISWDTMLDMLERLPFSFNDHGQVIWPSTIAGPEVIQHINNLLREIGRTPEQEQRFQNIVSRRREEINDRNRPRRLSRQSSE